VDRVNPFPISRAVAVSFSHGGRTLLVLPLGVTGCLFVWILPRGSRASIVMNSMRGILSRAEGAGSSSRGVRDGASEGSGPSGLLGDSPHVECRARVSKRVRGTASDGGGGADGFPFPPSVETATRGRDRFSPRVPGPLGGGNKQSCPENRGRMAVRLGGLGPWAYLKHPHKSVGFGLREGPKKMASFRRPYGIHWMRS